MSRLLVVMGLLASGVAGAEDPRCTAAVDAHDLPLIPTTVRPSSDFPKVLNAICTASANRELSKDVTVPAPAALAAATGVAPFEGLLAVSKSPGAHTAEATAAVNALLRLEGACKHFKASKLDATDIAVFRDVFKNPKAVAEVLAAATGKGAPDSVFKFGPKGAFQGPIPFDFGTLDSVQSNIINGLAQFVMDRAKAEALLYLTDQLKATLCRDRGDRYLKNFCTTFEALDANIRLYSMGAFIKTATLEDLKRLPELAAADASCTDPKAAAPMAVVRLSLAVYREERGGRKLLELVSNLHGVKLECDTPAQVQFDLDAKEPHAVGSLDCTAATNVVYEASRFIDAVTRQEGWEGVPTNAESPVLLAQMLGTLYTWEQLRAADGAKTVFKDADLAGFSTVTAQTIKFLVDLRDALAPPVVPPPAPPTPEERLAHHINIITGALLYLLELGSAVGLKPDPAWPTLIATLTDLAQRLSKPEDPAAMMMAATTLLARIPKLLPASFSTKLKLPPGVQKGLPLLVELANAKSSDEVAKTLEAAAAPVGSYRVKYEKPTIAINALLGPALSYESLQSQGTESAVFSVFAPVGVHLTYPLSKWFHVGGFLSILDIGAVVSPRLKNEVEVMQPDMSTETVLAETRVTFAQVLSPGMFLTLGLGNSPVVFGFGPSMVPALRQVKVVEMKADESGNPVRVETVETRNAFRFSVFVSIDIALFTF